MSENNEGNWQEDVVERLQGYADKNGMKVGEAANAFKDWLKAEFSVDNPLEEDPFYLSQWSEQFVIESRNERTSNR